MGPVEPKGVYIKLGRQPGKTETITLLLRFLLIFFKVLIGDPLMCGIPVALMVKSAHGLNSDRAKIGGTFGNRLNERSS
jgi:hypothetical protein